MKTECHCLFCPKHPLHAKRKVIQSPTGYVPGYFIPNSEKTGRMVDCLEPESQAFDQFDIDPTFEDFPVTAYGDGAAMTGFERDDVIVFARCSAEEFEAG